MLLESNQAAVFEVVHSGRAADATASLIFRAKADGDGREADRALALGRHRLASMRSMAADEASGSKTLWTASRSAGACAWRCGPVGVPIWARFAGVGAFGRCSASGAGTGVSDLEWRTVQVVLPMLVLCVARFQEKGGAWSPQSPYRRAA